MDFFARRFIFAESDPVVVIGEVGVNHNGDPELARRLVDAAVEAGVDIIKFQAFRTEQEISRFAELAPYQKQSVPSAASQFEMCKALELNPSDFRDLKAYCDKRHIGFLCSAFDFDSVDLLTGDLKARTLKIASGEVTNIPFLEYVGNRKVDVILSTGASTLDEVEMAISALRRAGCGDLVLLHCVSNYPAPLNELNLRAIGTLRHAFGLPIGFSDHSVGSSGAIAAVALGAVAIEKHFTFDHNMVGPDHKASAEPDELKRLVDDVRITKVMLGDGIKQPMPCELQNLPLIRRSLVANGRLRRGQRLTREMIGIKRPVGGIDPGSLKSVIGRELVRDLQEDEPITWKCLL